MFSSCFDYRITLLGEPQVGKTCILEQLVRKRIVTQEDYVPTLETDMEYQHEYKGTTYMCLIVDTAGVREFPAMRRLSISRANGFIVVFDLSNRDTFEHAKNHMKDVLAQKKDEEHVNIMLVGNKRDLLHVDNNNIFMNNSNKKQNKREKRRSIEIFIEEKKLQEGECLPEMARHLSEEVEFTNVNTSCMFFEVSAYDNQEITHMFENLLDLYDAQRYRYTKDRRSSSSVTFRKIPSPAQQNKHQQQQRRRAASARLSINCESSPMTKELQQNVKQKRYSLPKSFFTSSSSSVSSAKRKSMLSLPETVIPQ